MSSKSLHRPTVPELNMFLNPSYLDAHKGIDEAYDKTLTDYFQPYHLYVDKLIRAGFSQERVCETSISLSCLLAIESIPLHLSCFAKLWSEVYQKSGEHSKYKEYIHVLCERPEFVEYIDSVLLEERECLNVQEIYSFFCCLFPKVHTTVLKNQWTNLVYTLVSAVVADQPVAAAANYDDLLLIARRITADLRVLSLLFTVSPPKKSDISPLLLPNLESLVSICKKHQIGKQKRLITRQTSSEQDDKPDKQVETKSESTEAPQKKKRRKTLDNEEENKNSSRPGTSGESSSSSPKTEAESTPISMKPKLHPLLGPRPALDWVDLLAKAVHTAIQNIPK